MEQIWEPLCARDGAVDEWVVKQLSNVAYQLSRASFVSDVVNKSPLMERARLDNCKQQQWKKKNGFGNEWCWSVATI